MKDCTCKLFLCVRQRFSTCLVIREQKLLFYFNGWPTLEAIASLPRGHERFEPQMSAERRATLVAGWRQAVAQAMHTS